MKPTNSFKTLFMSKFSGTEYGKIPTVPILPISNKDATPNQRQDFNSGIENVDETENKIDKMVPVQADDFLVPSTQEEWTLPQYESLFHHMFVQKEEICLMEETEVAIQNVEKEKSKQTLQQWLKSLFGRQPPENEEINDTTGNENYLELDEIPIEICEKLRHIHVYL